MSRSALESECHRLLILLSKANATILQLQKRLNDKNTRVKNLAQQVSDTNKSKQRLTNIVAELQEERYISAETAQILKVKFL